MSLGGTDPSPGKPAPHRPGRALHWPAAITGIVLILALLGGFVFYRLVMLPERAAAAGEAGVERLLQATKAAFANIVQPQITVNQRVVLEQASPILELAVLQREVSVEQETENTWLGSTKRLRIRGTYRVKAGYDLKQPFTAKIDAGKPQILQVALPRAKLLSVELERLDALTVDNGLWNKVQPEEFAVEVNGLNLEAWRQAASEGLAAEAQKMLVEQLQQKLGPDIRLEIGASQPVFSTPKP